MPYVIHRLPATRSRILAPRLTAGGFLTAAAIGFAAVPAMADSGPVAPIPTPAPGSLNPASCSAAPVSQPLVAGNGNPIYLLVPGESLDNFDGTGWTLSGGASIVSAQLADGNTGDVLDLPAGATAASPVVCVTSGDRSARMTVRDVAGSAGLSFAVSYAGTPTWSSPRRVGEVRGAGSSWAVSNRVRLDPSDAPGWQLVRFTFIANHRNSEMQLYDFLVDPYAKG